MRANKPRRLTARERRAVAQIVPDAEQGRAFVHSLRKSDAR